MMYVTGEILESLLGWRYRWER